MPPTPSSSSVTIPQQKGGGSGLKYILFVVGIVIIAAVIAWFFFLSPSSPKPTPTPSITPTPTPTPTPSPLTFEESLAPITPLSFTPGTNAYTSLTTALKNETVSTGQLKTYLLQTADTPPVSYTFGAFASIFGLHPPQEITQAVDPQAPVYFMIFGRPDNTIGRGFAVELASPGLVPVGMQRWEANLPKELKSLNQLDITKSASTTFLDRIYQEVAIRYRNFTDPIKTIDYAVMEAQDGSSYLAFTNSRDHMFTLIDLLAVAVRGK